MSKVYVVYYTDPKDSMSFATVSKRTLCNYKGKPAIFSKEGVALDLADYFQQGSPELKYSCEEVILDE